MILLLLIWFVLNLLLTVHFILGKDLLLMLNQKFILNIKFWEHFFSQHVNLSLSEEGIYKLWFYYSFKELQCVAFIKNGLTAPFWTAKVFLPAACGRASLWKRFLVHISSRAVGVGAVGPGLREDPTAPRAQCSPLGLPHPGERPPPGAREAWDAAAAVGERKGRWGHAWPTWSPLLRWLCRGLRGEQWCWQPQWAARRAGLD